MKTRNLKSELRLKQKLITRGEGFPGEREGRDGDFTIRNVKGRGLFLFYKWGSKWYSSRLSQYVAKTTEKREPVIVPDRKPTHVGELTLDKGKVKVKKSQKESSQVISVNKSGIADSNTLHFKRKTEVAADGTAMDDDNSGQSEFLFENTGHVHLSLFNPAPLAGSSYDSFISYGRLHPETFSLVRWTVGYDASSGNFNWVYRSGSTTSSTRSYMKDTPSTTTSSNPKMSLTSTGTLVLPLTQALAHDRDKFLGLDTNGEVKYITGTNLRTFIGAGTSSVSVLDDLGDVNYSSGDLSIIGIDTIVALNDLTFDITGATIIDYDRDSTSHANQKGMHIDFDRIGNVSTGMDTNYALQIEANVSGASGGIQGTYGAHITVNQDNAGGGASSAYGVLIDVENADNNTGLYINNDNASGSGHDLWNASSATNADYFSLNTVESGETTLATVDGSGTAAHLTLDADGNVIIDSATNSITFKNNGTTRLTINDGVTANQNFAVGDTAIADANIQHDGDDVINFASEGVVSIPNRFFITEQASAGTDRANEGQLWVKNDTPNNLYFTDDTGQDVQITNNGSLAAAGGGSAKHYMEWYYVSANLASQNTFYSEVHHDEWGVSSSINTDLSSSGYSTTTLNNAWRMYRDARRVPYTGTITQFTAFVESTGAAADSDVEVALWWADALADDTQHSSTVNFTCDHICTLTFDFDTATRWMTKKTTSFNATAITEHDWLFVTVRKTTSGDGSSFNIHSTLTWDGA